MNEGWADFRARRRRRSRSRPFLAGVQNGCDQITSHPLVTKRSDASSSPGRPGSATTSTMYRLRHAQVERGDVAVPLAVGSSDLQSQRRRLVGPADDTETRIGDSACNFRKEAHRWGAVRRSFGAAKGSAESQNTEQYSNRLMSVSAHGLPCPAIRSRRDRGAVGSTSGIVRTQRSTGQRLVNRTDEVVTTIVRT